MIRCATRRRRCRAHVRPFFDTDSECERYLLSRFVPHRQDHVLVDCRAYSIHVARPDCRRAITCRVAYTSAKTNRDLPFSRFRGTRVCRVSAATGITRPRSSGIGASHRFVRCRSRRSAPRSTATIRSSSYRPAAEVALLPAPAVVRARVDCGGLAAHFADERSGRWLDAQRRSRCAAR